MKKSSENFRFARAGEVKIGLLLASFLKKTPQGACLQLEEIACLVDGKTRGRERDRVMTHLASCDRCYEVFLLTAEPGRGEIIPMKRTFFTPALRLAASFIIAVFSLFLIYKIVFIPGAGQKQKPAVMEKSAAPAEPLAERSHGLGGDVREKNKEAAGPPTAESEKKGDLQTAAKKDFFADERKPRREEEKIAGKTDGMIFEKSGDKAAGGKKAAPGVAAAAQEQDVGLVQDIDRQAEQQNMQNLQNVQNIKKNERFDREAAAQENQNLPDKIPQEQQLNETKQQTAAQQREKSSPPAAADPWAALESLQNKISRCEGHIPANEIEYLFKTVVVLSGELERELAGRRRQALDAGENRDDETRAAQLAPLMLVEISGDSRVVFPDVSYFYKKSLPGTTAHDFFNLALSGWCDRRGCRGESANAAATYDRKKLLEKWQRLRPQLGGIFLEIADQTIERLTR